MAKGRSNPVTTGYLILYNVACCLGWLYVLVESVKHISRNELETLWTDVEIPLKIVQTAAVLEVVHSLVGLVKSPWVTALMQVFSRVWTLWAVMNISSEVQQSIFFTLACTSWSLVEVPRYLFYALNLIGTVPYPVFWLRYSLFAVLYPTGISGELGCMYMAILVLKTDAVNSLNGLLALPQKDLILLALIFFVVLTYIPGSPKMYGHMLKTRKKQFAERKKELEAQNKKA
eukprot:gene10296-11200_t